MGSRSAGEIGTIDTGAGETVVAARQLLKRYRGKTVVDGISFDVPRGRCFGFLGPNGAGKTTTLRLILGLSPVDGGSLSVFGMSIPGFGRDARRRIGVVPQSDNLDPEFSVRENLLVYGAYFALPRRTLLGRIDELLDFVGLREKADSRISTLSGGMQRRLVFARALINDPELIILDEPTTGLDPQVRHMIWSRLRELRQAGKTLLLTTHYMEEAERLCDRLVIMERGRIVAEGSPHALIERHVEPEVIEIRGSRHDLDAAVSGIACRHETVGDTVYCYTADPRAVVERLERFPRLSFVQRPHNLEDVFLKLTGRELRV